MHNLKHWWLKNYRYQRQKNVQQSYNDENRKNTQKLLNIIIKNRDKYFKYFSFNENEKFNQ